MPVARVLNFSPGPGPLPLPVLEQVQRDLVSLPGVGASSLEVSHRGAWFTEVIREAEENLRALLGIPATHHVVFCQGGATMQFSMVAANFGARGGPADYVVTGSWASKALREAARLGDARAAWSGEAEGFVRVPTAEEVRGAVDRSAAYAHVTTNETIEGIGFGDVPAVADGVPLVADVSSDFLSKPIDISRFGVLYAGAQKNAGPAGVAVTIVRDDLLGVIPDGLPVLLDYRTYVEHGSRYNTPPVFAIYVLTLVTRWLLDEVGGLDAMHERNREKASLLYAVVDEHPGFFRGHARPDARSLMNVTFRLPSEELERTFLEEATAAGMLGLKGHRSVGGIRASIYNAVPVESVRVLAAFMQTFRERGRGTGAVG